MSDAVTIVANFSHSSLLRGPTRGYPFDQSIDGDEYQVNSDRPDLNIIVG